MNCLLLTLALKFCDVLMDQAESMSHFISVPRNDDSGTFSVRCLKHNTHVGINVTSMYFWLKILPKPVLFDSLSSSDAGISILLPSPSSTSEKATLLGMKSSLPNERNLKTETNLTKSKELIIC